MLSGEFSSDDESLGKKTSTSTSAVTAEDVPRLTNVDLIAQLRSLGVDTGPVVGSTRRLYEKKLMNILDNAVKPINGHEETEATAYVASTKPPVVIALPSTEFELVNAPAPCADGMGVSGLLQNGASSVVDTASTGAPTAGYNGVSAAGLPHVAAQESEAPSLQRAQTVPIVSFAEAAAAIPMSFPHASQASSFDPPAAPPAPPSLTTCATSPLLVQHSTRGDLEDFSDVDEHHPLQHEQQQLHQHAQQSHSAETAPLSVSSLRRRYVADATSIDDYGTMNDDLAGLDLNSPALRPVFLRDNQDAPSPRRAVRDLDSSAGGSFDEKRGRDSLLANAMATDAVRRRRTARDYGAASHHRRDLDDDLELRPWVKQMAPICLAMLVMAACCCYYLFWHDDGQALEKLQEAWGAGWLRGGRAAVEGPMGGEMGDPVGGADMEGHAPQADAGAMRN